jgi:hypothetical protein
MMSELDRIRKVIPLVGEFLQVTSAADDDGGNLWSAVRYNANNAWYVNSSNGNVNNNNAYNRYACVACPSVDFLFPQMLEAEESCYRNKHHSLQAARVHYHLAELFWYTKSICDNGLRVGRSKCFVLDYPVPREIFCAQYFDRNMHHLVAPLMTSVAEKEHLKCGSISHGNRTGHSAFTAALAVQDALRKVTCNWTKEAWLATQDYSGFFMSIPRQKAADMFRRLAESYNEPFLTDVACLYIMSDPTVGCIRLSPESAWGKVAPNKSLFTSRPGHGLPIGNFPSQIIANLYRTPVDAAIAKIDGVGQVVFVDDRMQCSADKELLKCALAVAEQESEELGLTVSKTKRYFQKVDKAVKFCGYVIKCDRIYISNRVVNACKYMVSCHDGMTTPKEESELSRQINSYFGLMAHARSYNIQKSIASNVLRAHRTLGFVRRHGQLVCYQKRMFTPIYHSLQNIKEFKHNDNTLSWRSLHRGKRWHTHCRMAKNLQKYESR